MDSMSDQERAFHIMILIASWPLLASCPTARVAAHGSTCAYMCPFGYGTWSGVARNLRPAGTDPLNR